MDPRIPTLICRCIRLLHCAAVRSVERVYLMTTNSQSFYRHLGFDASHRQHLLVWHRVRMDETAQTDLGKTSSIPVDPGERRR